MSDFELGTDFKKIRGRQVENIRDACIPGNILQALRDELFGGGDKGEPDVIVMIPHVVVGDTTVRIHRSGEKVHLMFRGAGSTQRAEKTQFIRSEVAADSSNDAVALQLLYPMDHLLFREVQLLTDGAVGSGVNGEMGLYSVDYFSVSGIHAAGVLRLFYFCAVVFRGGGYRKGSAWKNAEPLRMGPEMINY